MAARPETTEGSGRLGVASGQVIQEFGYDSDCDEELRADIEAAIGSPLEDESYGDVIDVALIWWRDDDGDTQDLTDVLTDALTTLEDGGLIWLLAPKAGRHGHVPPAEVEEAATTAGLHTTSTIAVAPAWSAYRLTSRGRGR
ncbi:DUF3052 domain-containing protein [Pseudactinotalea terrae]|uniref:DUF3052 domain-containing protein n=1 Tax=Pseudactinotalea terrae TaxID=1743262 RepID=UPI0012E29CD1|nr:DUF3052 domain-containing protein [Pseudactinotalea terrae]